MIDRSEVKLRLKSGNSYCLKELFSGDNDKIVIPDLQRDYCWGGSSKNLVGKFMDTILNDISRDEEITMGLIYGYVNKELTVEHVQLCDGQQRLTTLFLLIGEINRRTNNKFSGLLMSSFEEYEDDQEPYLQYSIRESSLYFLSDFTKRYFLSSDLKLEEVANRPWYLNSYAQDPTIVSILEAVKCIKEKLDGMTEEGIVSLGEFVSTKLKFLYYDMGDRKNGEETFVVINTTGEPLSANQNMKPLFIRNNKEYIDGQSADVIWEEMETWFWRNRNRVSKTPHTSDEGMAAFLQCAALLYSFNVVADSKLMDITEDDASEDAFRKMSVLYKEFSDYYDLLTNPSKKQEGLSLNYSKIPLSEIWRIFKAYKRVYTMDYSERFDDNFKYGVAEQTACGYTQKQLYVLLSSTNYCLRFPDTIDEHVKRIVHIFRVMSFYKDLSRPLIPTLRALVSITEMRESDPVCLRNSSEFNRYGEECAKLEIIASENPERRNAIEYLFARAEAHEIFKEANDSIQILLTWGENKFDSISKYFDRFIRLWPVTDYGSLCDNLDELRRAFLLLGLSNFPINREKLCSNSKEWYFVISNNQEKIKGFIDKLFEENPMTLGEFIHESLSSAECLLTPSMRMLISDKSLLQFCEKKKIREEPHCIEVLRGIRRSGEYKIIFNGLLYETKTCTNLLNRYSDNTLYVDFQNYNLTVDFYFVDEKGYRVIVWSGKKLSEKDFEFFEDLETIGFMPYEKGDKGFSLPLIPDHQEAHDKLYETISWIEERLS